MKRMKIFSFILLAMSLLLAACSESDNSGTMASKKSNKQGNIYETDYNELLKLLDNNETFWLITLDADPKFVNESGILDEFNKQVGRMGIDSISYLNTYDMSETEKVELSEEYSYSRYNDWYKEWDYEQGGLMLVSNGSIIQTPYKESTFYDSDFAEGEFDELLDLVEVNIRDLFEDLDAFGIEY